MWFAALFDPSHALALFDCHRQFVAIIVIFVVQNLGVVTMAFLGFSIRAPLAMLAAIPQRAQVS